MQLLIMTDKTMENGIRSFGEPVTHPGGWRYCLTRTPLQEAQAQIRSLAAAPDGRGLSVGVVPVGFRPSALFFDVDATLIQEESIDVLAEAYGCGPEVAAVTEKAMNGGLDFMQALKERVALLKGMKESDLRKVGERLSLQPGAGDLADWAKKESIPLFMISGGFSVFVKALSQKLGFEDCAANELEIRDGRLTGQVSAGPVDAAFKSSWMQLMCQKHGLDPARVVATGDGANDRYMLASAGLAAGFMPKATLLPLLSLINRTGSYGFHLDFLKTAAAVASEATPLSGTVGGQD